MQKILYYDCFAGISGDMNLAALLDVGVDADDLKAELRKLNLDGYEIQIQRAQKKGITGTQVQVITQETRPVHRSLAMIEAVIEKSALSHPVKQTSLAVFRKLAQAEARVHDIPVEQVHFHEIGALDTLIDVVGGAIGLAALQVDHIIGSPVELGGGWVHCAHGVLPVPAPATAELLRGIPVTLGTTTGEATTPTGAAWLASVVNTFSDRTAFTPLKIAYGIGRRDTERPNVLRLMLGEQAAPQAHRESLSVMECNIDDMNPELYEHVLEKLMSQGAKDVYLTPLIMKKGRPGILLSVVCEAGAEARLAETVFTETTTLGIRHYLVDRIALERVSTVLATRFGEVAVKTARLHGRVVNSKAEYEDCKRLANACNVPIKTIYDEVHRLLADQTQESDDTTA
jgi:hypothetical protein